MLISTSERHAEHPFAGRNTEHANVLYFRMRAQLKTVEDILLSGENLEIGSDSDISDASQISNEQIIALRVLHTILDIASDVE